MTRDGLLRHPRLAPVAEEVRAAVDGAADPEAVAVGLLRLLEAGADPGPHAAGWVRLLDASPAAVDALAARPALVAEIPARRGTYDREAYERRLDEALAALPTLEERLDRLRAERVDESLRIAWQDVVEGADLTVVTRRISDLAEILFERVLRGVQAELAARFGRPWHGAEPVGVAVIAMGKLGGAELNYSSDIDLIFLYGKDGETDGGPGGRSISNREYFHRLTERVTREVNAVTPLGRLYRVDLRLRPEGAVGSLARSFASTVAYYRRLGETWERQAHLKARCIAGDRELGDAFVKTIRDWVLGRGLTFAEIAALKRIKQRIEQGTVARGEEKTEVKLGYGGIRDVEYVIQFLQLLHGARLPEVRHHNSLTALRLLESHGAVLPAERDVLDDAYRFLRLVEHRIQLVQGAQAHRLPEDEEELRRLARRAGYDGVAAFRDAYTAKAARVRDVFQRLFAQLFLERDEEQVRETNLVLAADGDAGELSEVLRAHGIADEARGVWAVEELCRESSPLLQGSPRTRKFFADLFPRLLDTLRGEPDPDAALRRFEKITARVGARATLYEAMIANPELLRWILDLAGHSAFLSNFLTRAPGTLDQLVDALATNPSRGLASFEDIPTETVPTADEPARILQDYKHLELLRIGLRDVRGEASLAAVSEDLTRLADVIVRLAYERARKEARHAGDDLVVIALGRFGAAELLYGSDLDLVFFARDGADRDRASGLARRLAALLGTPTDHGRLYEVDLRLRPDGKGGPLVTTPNVFRDYFERGIGQTWERMAYTRARPVAGPPSLCEEVADHIAATVYAGGFTDEDKASVRRMREKLAEAGGPDSIKRAAAGGLVDLEFIAQMEALRHGRDDPRFRLGHVPRLLALLAETGRIHGQAAADLHAAYAFLRALESRIRIVADLPEDRLPEDPAALRTLARRLAYIDTDTMPAEDALREEYAYHKTVAARAFATAVD